MNQVKRTALLLILCCIMLLVACSNNDLQEDPGRIAGSPGHLQVHFIDVGQGDAILVRLPGGENILIDAGDPGQGDRVLSYLHEQGVIKIHHLIATHPHADHIGGMPAVIGSLEIAQVYMPRATHTTQTYENLLLALQAQGLKAREARAGVRLSTEPGISAMFVAPNQPPYENLNDYSAVLHLQYLEHAFLLTGDATSLSGMEILAAGHNIRAHVLQLPHHGSSNSAASHDFLAAVAPQMGVISLGKDNPYGHPHQEIMELLAASGVEVFRTDRHGDIVFTSDGQKIEVSTQYSLLDDVATGLPGDNYREYVGKDFTVSYIGNINSRILHRSDCSGLPLEHNRIYWEDRDQALDQGFRPCRTCNP